MIAAISFPLTNPVLIFTVIMFIVLLAPIFLRRINIPDIVGLIMAGVIVGSHGLNILSQDIGFSIFGSVGLLYLMFLAGLEIDLNDFNKHKRHSTVFGLLTFCIPFGVSFIVFYFFLPFDLRASLLIGSMLASHTLVAYPILGRLGITNRKIVTILIGGTIIADTVVLFILGMVSESVQGYTQQVFWIKTILSFSLFFILIIKGLPVIARWFFKYQDSEKSIQYVFVLTSIFFAATLAELLDIEPLIGAFFAGLSLNRLIIRSSPLMNRVVFIGNTLFIPFFLISIGMLVDLRHVFSTLNGLIILAVLVVLALGTKYLAAFFMQKIFRYGAVERGMLYGLSIGRAASAIAIIKVANDFELVNDLILNDTILLILITSLISSIITQRAGKKLAALHSAGATERPVYDRILVSISNPATIEKLIEFSLLAKDPGSDEPIFPITVVPDSESAAHINAENRKILEKAIIHSSSADNKTELITRIDMNVVDGLTRAIKEFMINKIIIGWHSKTNLDILFGNIVEKLAEKTEKMIIICRINTAIELVGNLHVFIPENIQYEKGFKNMVYTLCIIARNMNSTVTMYGPGVALTATEKEIIRQKHAIRVNYTRFTMSSTTFEKLDQSGLPKNDLLVFIKPRKNTISHHRVTDNYLRIINHNFDNANLLLLFPEQKIYHSGVYGMYTTN